MTVQKVDELFENNRKYTQAQLANISEKSWSWAYRMFKKYSNHVIVEDGKKYMLGVEIKRCVFKMEIE